MYFSGKRGLEKHYAIYEELKKWNAFEITK